jgi:effector-binding domain-containing protein
LLRQALIGTVMLLAVLLIVGLMLPASAHVERSIDVAGPQARVFALVNGFRAFNAWSPWHSMDPDATYTFEGPDHGVGATITWDGDRVGTGSQEIIASVPMESVRIELDFGRRGTAESYFLIEPGTGGVRLTWGFDSDFGFDIIDRYFGLFVEQMVGGMYGRGLTAFKELAESLPDADWSDIELSVIEVEPVPIAYTSSTSAVDVQSIGRALAAAFGKVSVFLGEHDLAMAGQPLAITSSRGRRRWVFDAGIPIVGGGPAERAGGEVRIGSTWGGKVVRAVHTGPYAGLGETYDKVDAFVAAHGYQQVERRWEQYVSDPGVTPEEYLITYVFQPVD